MTTPNILGQPLSFRIRRDLSVDPYSSIRDVTKLERRLYLAFHPLAVSPGESDRVIQYKILTHADGHPGQCCYITSYRAQVQAWPSRATVAGVRWADGQLIGMY